MSQSPPLAGGLSDERERLVEQARQHWIAKLIDLSRRNNLLYFRPLQLGTLELSDCDDDELDRLLHGSRLHLSALVEEEALPSASGKLQEIRRKALANLEEKGLETLFLAVGMATWEPADEGRPAEAPVLLLPIEIEGKARESRTLSLRRSGDAQVNPVLLHVLQAELGVEVSTEALMTPEEADVLTDRLNPTAVFNRLTNLASQAKVRGFSVGRRVVLGNFSFQKMAMVKDLREQGPALVAHDLIAAIAGDRGAREAVLEDTCDISPSELDKTAAGEEFLVMDADSSQQRVVHCVRNMQDGVIQGPPGTGKSQTIANLIAALAADGKKVLFVAEKRAALEVVLRRLEERGLGHLALDLHGASTTRRHVMGKIAETLDIVHRSTPAEVEDAHRRFEQRRAALNDHVSRLHVAREPSGLSVFQIQGFLLRVPEEARSDLRWGAGVLAQLDAAALDEIADALEEVGSAHYDLFLLTDPSPWNGARIHTGHDAHEALDVARRASSSSWPAAAQAIATFERETGFMPLMSLDSINSALDLALGVNEVLGRYDPDIFSVTSATLDALAPARKGTVSAAVGRMFNGDFRRARKTVMGFRKDAKGRSQQLIAEVEEVLRYSAKWRSYAGTESASPRTIDTAAETEALVRKAQADLQTLDRFLASPTMNTQLPALPPLLKALSDSGHVVFRLPRLHEMETRIRQLGLEDLLHLLRREQPPVEMWPGIFKHSYYSSLLDIARRDDPNVAAFDGRVHDRLVEEFKRLDELRLELSMARVRRSHAEHAVASRTEHRDQDAHVRKEAARKSRHLPLRQTFERAPDVLTSLRPCWMASPLTVSQLLGAARTFDVVIFDEASQVLPHDAIPSLLRGRRTVVAGDRHQLPPTTFFFYSGEEDEAADESDPTAGFESILDLMSSFLNPWSLDWHYRSKSESLIAFSNRHIYGDRLVTFPSPSLVPPAVTHELVRSNLVDGQEDSSDAEVRKVVDLVIDHAAEMMRRAEHEQETLGVIAMGVKHARRLEFALDEALKIRPELEPFFDVNRSERFFIKNLERVQGDERDRIVLSIGYGKDRAGKLPYRFGPLLMEGGERRLNVAITRARKTMTVVSSFSHTDMDPARSSKRGVELLRLYLQFAESNAILLGDHSDSGVPLNPFEQDIMDALTKEGIELLPQWGASQYRLDLVAAHPDHPGRFVLAIECDGATYHSAPTARDRDRLRQQHLEALGWRFHRIWSTDWFLRREDEVERAVAAFREAVRHADRTVNGQVTAREPKSPDAMDPPVREGDSARQGSRPSLRRAQPIDSYSDHQLRRLLDWIKSDGRLRTPDELLEEMVDQLGFRRRGNRIIARLRAVISKHHA